MYLLERNKAQTKLFRNTTEIWEWVKARHFEMFKGHTFSIFPFPSFSTLFKIPGLSPDPWALARGVGGAGCLWSWGLKCNPGPVTTKGWPLRAKDQPHFLNCNVIPQQTLQTDYISKDYTTRLLPALIFKDDQKA